jgi:hypothetical protein
LSKACPSPLWEKFCEGICGMIALILVALTLHKPVTHLKVPELTNMNSRNA